MPRSAWPVLKGLTRPLKMKEWGDLTVMAPDTDGPEPHGRGLLSAGKDWLHIDAGSALENPVVTLYAGADLGAEKGWDEVEEITVISTTGFLALCDSGYAPVRRENLATAGPGPYLLRVHAADRSTDGKKTRFLIQVIPGDRAGAESGSAAPAVEEAAGPLLVRTSFDQPSEWARLLQAVEGGSVRVPRAWASDTGLTCRRPGRDRRWPARPLRPSLAQWSWSSGVPCGGFCS
ncbi:hypothetical protein [Streptomyces sp. NPDC056160]|uniref:hypothetical protein n=1 Tax=Streptomyces sp. NPDC056160 TaxID=3345731 RepID=UPI0035DC9E6E